MEQSLTTNTIWLLFCTALVFLMQAGFCCLESGLSRPLRTRGAFPMNDFRAFLTANLSDVFLAQQSLLA